MRFHRFTGAEPLVAALAKSQQWLQALSALGNEALELVTGDGLKWSFPEGNQTTVDYESQILDEAPENVPKHMIYKDQKVAEERKGNHGLKTMKAEIKQDRSIVNAQKVLTKSINNLVFANKTIWC